MVREHYHPGRLLVPDQRRFRTSLSFHTNAFSSAPALRPATLLARLNLLQTAMNGGVAPGPADPNLAEFALLPTDGSESQRD